MLRNFMKNIFLFDAMLTPKIITFVYWVLLLACVIGGVSTMFNSYSGGFLTGFGILVGGAIGARIWCELMIVLFKIHENLQKIANKSDTPE